MKTFDSRSYSIADFLEWHRNNLLDLSPNFQRRSVWTRAAKSFLMDTVVRGKPMPKVLITQSLQDQRNVRTVVDGQQRIRTILDYIAGGFTMLRAHNPEFARTTFDRLPPEVQSSILQYEIGVDLLYDVALSDLLDIFARINTYSVVLNTQEKLNAKYLGIFKTYAYEMGHRYADYFIEGGILTKKQVTRMAEAQLSSDLLVALCDGIQTVKNIEKLYKRYENTEDVPVELATARENFISTMSYVGAIYPPEQISETNWARPHLFYTLFSSVAHALIGVRGLEEVPQPALNQNSIAHWRSTLDEISALYDEYTSDEEAEIPVKYRRFIDFARRRTTDTEARLERSKFVLAQL